MGRAKTITRRSLLIGSFAVAGGVAFGGYKLAQTPENPLAVKDGVAITPWVKITKDGITLITPHVDFGQGAYHMQALLIAEELDLELGQFTVDPGLPSAAYWNTAVADENVPFQIDDDGWIAEGARLGLQGIFKLAGLQVTGGSSSVPDSFEKLRRAGATARETFKAVASERTGVPVAKLHTRSGSVILPDGTGLPYTDLAADAADIEPVQVDDLRAPSDWTLLGKNTERLDILPKSTGTLSYGIDVQLPGMLHASLRVNPRRTGVRRIKLRGAKEMRGVERVVHVTGGVAVVARNTWYAIEAARAIEFVFEPATYPAEQREHWAEVKASFTRDRRDRTWRHDGDVETALKKGDVIEQGCQAGYVAHAPLEPLSAVVLVQGDRAEVWAGHQLPQFAQRAVAKIAGIPTDHVTFHNQYSGGSFGHRFDLGFIERAAEVARQMPGTPIKLTYSREEDFAQDNPRQIGASRARGVVRDGRIEALDLKIATTSSTQSLVRRLGFPFVTPDPQIVHGASSMPYAIPHLRVTGYKVPELAPSTYWRSVGAVSAGFFAEVAIDELIHAAGADPMQERLRMIEDPASRRVLEALAEMSDWADGGAAHPAPNQGRGVAIVNSFGVPTAQVIEVTHTQAGIRIDRVFVACEVGTIIDPVNFENNVQGGVIWGLGHAMNCEITFSDGAAMQQNYYDAEGMRMHQAPEIIVRGLESGGKVRGIGEPPTPPAAPALSNAIFAATGQRVRELPMYHHVDFI